MAQFNAAHAINSAIQVGLISGITASAGVAGKAYADLAERKRAGVAFITLALLYLIIPSSGLSMFQKKSSPLTVAGQYTATVLMNSVSLLSMAIPAFGIGFALKSIQVSSDPDTSLQREQLVRTDLLFGTTGAIPTVQLSSIALAAVIALRLTVTAFGGPLNVADILMTGARNAGLPDKAVSLATRAGLMPPKMY